jgi:hypothetical protein
MEEDEGCEAETPSVTKAIVSAYAFDTFRFLRELASPFMRP